MQLPLKYPDLVSMFEKSVEQFYDRPLFGTKSGKSWSWQSYREFHEEVARVRVMLTLLGVRKADKVAVISNNRHEWVSCCFASYGIGAAYVPMYQQQNEAEWIHILRDSESRVCFVANDKIRDQILEQKSSLPELQYVLSFDSDFQSYLEQSRFAPAVAVKKPNQEDIALLIYTSGTTGLPKGVCLTHRNLASNVSALSTILPFSKDDRSLAFLPWAHVYGLNVELNGMISIGASIAICPTVEKILDYLGEVKPTVLFAVPRIWNRIYENTLKNISKQPKFIQNVFKRALSFKAKVRQKRIPFPHEAVSFALADKLIFSKIRAKVGGQLKFAISGAAALTKEVGEFIDTLGLQMYEGYGMTETSPIAATNTPEYRRIGSVGKPLPGVEIKIENGEVLIGGPGVMANYQNLPDETAAVLTGTGFMRSGDLGHFDSDGFLYITGRVKELYKLENGRYVAPAPLEERIVFSPYIVQAMIYGADRPYNVALLVPDLTALRAWAAEQKLESLSVDALLGNEKTRKLFAHELERYSKEFKSFERVKDFVLITEEFSTQNDMLTPTLKVKRRNVLQRYGKDLEALWH